MTVAITGASGMIGSELARSLADDGIRVVSLVRRPPRKADEVMWDPERHLVDVEALRDAGVTAIVHLAGAGVGDHRWTNSYKRQILRSRVDGTEAIATAAADIPSVRALISASAIGYYGDTGDRIADETDPPGEGFLADVVTRWEAAAAPAQEAGLRVAFPRTGLVVTDRGGAWGRMVPLFRVGLGGRIGPGTQLWSFISLTDEVRALRFLLDNELRGPFNLVAPEPITNAEATRLLGETLHRPAALPVPAFALRTVLGEFAREIVVNQAVVPRRLQAAGFTWRHPTLADALAAELVA